MIYLEFQDLDDYLEHLRHFADVTNAEIVCVRGERDERGVVGVTYYAVLTRRTSDYISLCAITLLATNSVNLMIEQDALRTKLHDNFDRVCASVRERGFGVERGRWTLNPFVEGR